MERVCFNVLKFKKESFVYAGPSYGKTGTVQYYGRNCLINGIPSDQYERAIGDNEYIVVKGDVTSMELAKSPIHTLIHYEVKDGYTDLATKVPLSVDEFNALDEVRRGIYKPIYREDAVPNAPFDIKIVDIDCQPKTFPAGVMVTVPDYLQRLKNTWHVLPCYLDPKALYTRLVAAVKDEIASGKHAAGTFHITDYDNIGSFTVKAGFKLHGFDIEYKFDVINVSVDGRYGAQLPKIQGENLDDLNKNVSEWIAKKIEEMRLITQPKECPCCGGRIPKGKVVTIPLRRR